MTLYVRIRYLNHDPDFAKLGEPIKLRLETETEYKANSSTRGKKRFGVEVTGDTILMTGPASLEGSLEPFASVSPTGEYSATFNLLYTPKKEPDLESLASVEVVRYTLKPGFFGPFIAPIETRETVSPNQGIELRLTENGNTATIVAERYAFTLVKDPPMKLDWRVKFGDWIRRKWYRYF